jgi:hypothetical protein
MGNTIFLVATHPVCHFLSFQHFQSALLHQGRLLGKILIEKEPDLMEKSLQRMEITNGPQDHKGTFHTHTCQGIDAPCHYQHTLIYGRLLGCLLKGVAMRGRASFLENRFLLLFYMKI